VDACVWKNLASQLSLFDLGVTALNATCDAMDAADLNAACFRSFEASRVCTFKIFYKENYWFAKKN